MTDYDKSLVANKDIPAFKIYKDEHSDIIAQVGQRQMPLKALVTALLNRKVKFCRHIRLKPKQEAIILFFQYECWECKKPQYCYTVYPKFSTVCDLEYDMMGEMWSDGDIDKSPQIQIAVQQFLDSDKAFGVNMLAVADGRPETLSLKQVIEYHVDFQFEVATRKYQNLLRKEMERREVQEGLIKACDVIDLIIEILRGSKTQKQVKECLIMGVTDGIRFKSKSSERMAAQLCFTERQATAILEMRLQKLIGLEVEALLKDHEATVAKITKYEDILNHYDSMSEVIMEDLTQIKKEYGHKRKTAIENAEAIVLEEPKVEEMDVVFLMDRFGYAKTIDTSAYERNKEAVHNENKYVFQCKNTDKICVFTDLGMMHSIKVMDIPYGRFRDKGTPIDNLGNYSSQKEQMIYVDALENIKNNKLLFVSAAGMVKLVDGSEFDVVKRTIAATKLSSEEDRLILAEVCQEQEYVVLQTKNGVFLRFLTSEVPEKKKAAVGVRGIRMAEDDAVEHAYLLASRMDYTITYHDKEISLTAKIKLAKRDTKGTKIRV